MPNNNENSSSCKIFTAQTTKLKNGEVAIKEAILKNVPTPLFILFSYAGKGASAFLSAAKLKKKRLALKYPDAEVRIIENFYFPHEFKAEWTKLYNELTDPQTACKYSLWQIHFFGHGGPEALYFQKHDGEDKIYFNKQEQMERLPWHPNQGIFVLHSCRGAAYEDTLNVDKIEAQTCLANTISTQQKTRCLGKVTYGNNNFLDVIDYPIDENNVTKPLAARGTILYSTEKWEAEVIEEVKYRSNFYYNFLKYSVSKPVVLWGYALLTNKSEKKTLSNKQKYESNKKIQQSILPKAYPIYQEIKKLADKNQILPCRVVNNGELEPRVVEVDIFNQNDVEYI